MSKMSQLNMELTEQASQLGFHSIEEAEINGYEVDYKNATLVEGRELAHKHYLKRKETILRNLEGLYDSYTEGDYKTNIEKTIIKEAIDFIKEGEI